MLRMLAMSERRGPRARASAFVIAARLTVAIAVVAALAASVRADTGTTVQLGATPNTQQSSPAISGSGVTWTNFDSTTQGFDIFYQDVAVAGATPTNLTASLPGDQFLEDIDNGSVVFTNTSPNAVASDILLVDASTGALSNVAAGSSTVNFARPAIARSWIVFERITTQVDIDIYDRSIGGSPGFQVTFDAAEQRRPRVSGNVVVYEDYNANPSVASVAACQLGTNGCTTTLVATVGRSPDVDGDNIVYVGSDGTNDQIFLYSMSAASKRQLTTAASQKSSPRVSGSRVVWSDKRSGSFDVYSYDLGTATESPLITSPSVDETVGDLDGDRLVYATSTGGVFLYTFPGVQPSNLPVGCDPAKTDLVDGPQVLTQTTRRPVYGSHKFQTQTGRTYYLCIDNGKPDGSQRSGQVMAAVDNGVVLSPADFKPQQDPPRHVAAALNFQLDRRNRGVGQHGDDRHGEDDGGEHGGKVGANVSQHEWDVALFGAPPTTIAVSIRVAK